MPSKNLCRQCGYSLPSFSAKLGCSQIKIDRKLISFTHSSLKLECSTKWRNFCSSLLRARHSLLYYIILQYTWIDLSSDLGDFVTVSRGLLSIPYFCLIASRTFSLATSSRSLCFCLSFWKALRAFSLNRKREKTVKWQNLNQRYINNSHLVSFRRRCARVRRCAGMQSGN